jgi:AraC-like DNA-binding protein
MTPRALRSLRSIYSQSLDLRLGRLRVRRFSLNRHAPEKGWVEMHGHAHGQFLLYLTGNGRQRVGAALHEVHPSRLFYFAPGTEHSFVQALGRLPLCLALDVDIPGDTRDAQVMLTQGDMLEVRRAVAALHAWQGGEALGPETVRPGEAGAVLTILDVFMRATALQEKRAPDVAPTVLRRVREVLQKSSPAAAPVSRAAEVLGYHPDHLSRLLRRETGMTASQWRAAERLKRARQELGKGGSVADAAERSGFADPNYFARWFRRQTGLTPRDWISGRRKA